MILRSVFAREPFLLLPTSPSLNRADPHDGPVGAPSLARREGDSWVLTRALLVLFVVLFQIVSVGGAAAQTLTIGVAHPLPEGSVIEGEAAFPVLVREATGAPLLEDGRMRPGEFGLRISDRLVLSDDYTKWSLRIRPSAVHTDGAPVRAVDARIALAQCRSGGVLPSIRDVSVRIEGEGSDRAEWIDLTVVPFEGDARKGVRTVVGELSRCSIFKGEARRLFDGEFGYGTNVVGPGYYVITDFVVGRSLRLARFEGGLPPSGAAAQVIFRAFDDDGAGLTSLRAGGVDLLIEAGEEVLKRAERDDTLAITRCSGITVLHRKDLVVPCEGRLAVARMHYQS